MRTTQTKKTIGEFSFFLRDKIGSGSSSDVFRGLSLKTSKPVAVKVIPVTSSLDSCSNDVVETDVLSKLKDSANIIQLRGAIKTKNNTYIFTELCQNGTLEQQLSQARRFDEENATRIMQQVIAGVKETVRVGVVHRDLKPSNIFRRGSAYKLGDFGYAMDASQSGKKLRENVGSPSYMALENLKMNQYSHQSDFWALGVIFFQMLTGRTPWKARTEKALIQQIQQFQLKKAMPTQLISPISKKFLQRTLVVNVAERMTVEEFMEWSFEVSEEGEYQQPIKVSIHQPMRSTIDLSSMQKVKGVMANKSSIHLNHIGEQPPTPTEEDANEAIKFKKRNRLESAIKNTEFVDTIHRATSGKQKEIPQTPKTQASIKQFSPLTRKEAANKPSVPQTPREKTGDLCCVAGQVQAQLDYARFLLRVMRKVGDSLKTKDPRVVELRLSLLYFVSLKLEELKELRFLRASSEQKDTYMVSPHYALVLEFVDKYRERAQEEARKVGKAVGARSEREFMRILTKVMGFLYSNVAPLKSNPEELQRSKVVLVILEDLVGLSGLFLLERQENWIDFRDSSNITDYISRTSPSVLSLSYFQEVQTSYLRLAEA